MEDIEKRIADLHKDITSFSNDPQSFFSMSERFGDSPADRVLRDFSKVSHTKIFYCEYCGKPLSSFDSRIDSTTNTYLIGRYWTKQTTRKCICTDCKDYHSRISKKLNYFKWIFVAVMVLLGIILIESDVLQGGIIAAYIIGIFAFIVLVGKSLADEIVLYKRSKQNKHI